MSKHKKKVNLCKQNTDTDNIWIHQIINTVWKKITRSILFFLHITVPMWYRDHTLRKIHYLFVIKLSMEHTNYTYQLLVIFFFKKRQGLILC